MTPAAPQALQLGPHEAPDLQPLFLHAAELIAQADALVVAVGAGMGVDSGLPDFRGTDGFWNEYPALAAAGLEFYRIASPRSFADNPALAWGFYGHRLALYRKTVPHDGFRLLQEFAQCVPLGVGVFTSNVDGQFQKAGFDAKRIHECHGSIHHLQCTKPCCSAIWQADDFEPEVDEVACLLRNAPPRCPHCDALARPNVLMFSDVQWEDKRAAQQEQALLTWLRQAERPVVVEIGAGTAIPSVRHFSHTVLCDHSGRLVRINPTDCTVPSAFDVGLPLGALAALQGMASALEAL